jgi:hypothetical protein
VDIISALAGCCKDNTFFFGFIKKTEKPLGWEIGKLGQR